MTVGGLGSGWRLARLRLRARGRLRVEGRVQVAAGVRVTVAGSGRVTLGDGCRLAERVRIEATGGEVHVGPGCSLGERSVIVSLARITLGAGCVLGDWALVNDAEPAYADVEAPVRAQSPRTAPVRIGEGARIGPHAAVLAGARVADGAVIGPYAVVRRESAPEGSAASPA